VRVRDQRRPQRRPEHQGQGAGGPGSELIRLMGRGTGLQGAWSPEKRGCPAMGMATSEYTLGGSIPGSPRGLSRGCSLKK
jgi:hypothetical protein